jgi:hypothetical protein
MSLIIVGFGRVTTRDLGAASLEQQCVWCSERVVYRLLRARTWFSFFFVPVIPYRTRYCVECPACARALVIRGDEVEAARRGELRLGRQ